MEEIIRGNEKLIEYKNKIKLLEKKEKEKLVNNFIELLEEYPIHLFIQKNDLANIMKNIIKNHNNPVLVEEIKAIIKPKKTRKNKKEIENIEEEIKTEEYGDVNE